MIRPARPDDAAFAAPLIQDTIGGIGHALTGEADDRAAARVIEAFFARRGHRLSFEHALVVEADGGPVGLAVAYPGALAAALDAPLAARLRDLGRAARIDPETGPGEFYLDTLVVAPDARGRGLGTALVGAVEARARAAGEARVGLLVEAGNPGAAALYRRLGFAAAGRRTVAGGAYDHLVKPV